MYRSEKRSMAEQHYARYEQLIAEAEAEEQAQAVKEYETLVWQQAYTVVTDGLKPVANPDNPIPVTYGMPVIPNMHYLVDGNHCICMPADSLSSDPVILTLDNFGDVMYLCEEDEEDE